jgi:hypothetical protein
VRPRVRLLLASCAFVGILTYIAWHKQQPTLLAPVATTAPPAPTAVEPPTAPEPPPEVRLGGVPQSLLDPLPAWHAAPVPELKPTFVPKEEETAGEAPRPAPEAQEEAKAEAAASPPAPQPVTTTGSSDVMPMPRPRPRKPLAVGAPKRPAAGAPLRIN